MSDIAAKLAARWQARSPGDLANRLAAPFYGQAGNWDLPKDVTPKRDLLYLAVGIPDSASLPKDILREAAVRVYEQPGDVALRYGFGQGPVKLREWLADYRNQTDPAQVDENWFQLTNGSSGAIDLIVRTMIDPGDVIIAEDPTYMGTLHNFRGVGADIRFVSMDDEGLNTDHLTDVLAQLKEEGRTVKLIYTISAFHNPTGATLSLRRREALLQLAYEHDVMILDDEAYRDLWYDTPPPPALSALADGYGVITTGTFSKTVATGLRVGWVHARPEIIELFGNMRFAMGQNGVGIRTVQEFLGGGHFTPHVEKIREIYRRKRDILDAALRREVGDALTWQVPQGGFYLWATVNAPLTVTDLWRTGVEEGIAVNPGSGFSPTGESQCVRIAYAWTPEDQLEEAARRKRVANGDVA